MAVRFPEKAAPYVHAKLQSIQHGGEVTSRVEAMSTDQLMACLAGYAVSASPESSDKFTRATPFAAQVNAGNVQIVGGDYVRAYMDELELFPGGRKDDQVDASSRAFAQLIDPPMSYRRPTWGSSGHVRR